MEDACKENGYLFRVSAQGFLLQDLVDKHTKANYITASVDTDFFMLFEGYNKSKCIEYEKHTYFSEEENVYYVLLTCPDTFRILNTSLHGNSAFSDLQKDNKQVFKETLVSFSETLKDMGCKFISKEMASYSFDTVLE